MSEKGTWGNIWKIRRINLGDGWRYVGWVGEKSLTARPGGRELCKAFTSTCRREDGEGFALAPARSAPRAPRVQDEPAAPTGPPRAPAPPELATTISDPFVGVVLPPPCCDEVDAACPDRAPPRL